MSPRHLSCLFGHAFLAGLIRVSDSIAVYLDGQRWPTVALVLVAVADVIERHRECLANTMQGGQT